MLRHSPLKYDQSNIDNFDNLSESRMKILLLSAYHAQSHARWCKGLVDSAPHVEWTVLTLPGRRFSWRYPGNAYSWFMTERDLAKGL